MEFTRRSPLDGREGLRLLYVLPMPASPPLGGAQARLHGLMSNLALRHRVTAVALVDADADLEATRRAMAAYCADVVLVPNPNGQGRAVKRRLQLRSLVSRRSFEHHYFAVPALQAALDRVLRREKFDLVDLEFTYLGHLHLRQSPPGMPPPPLVLGTHEIGSDLVRQVARSRVSLGRRLYAALNWRKLQRDERELFRAADGISVCSVADQERLLEHVPGARTVVVPNAADVDHYRPRPDDPPPDGRTVVFFGLLSTFPNIDGVLHFLRDIWPRVVAQRPGTRCRILGARPPESIRRLAGPGVEIAGFVEDLRPHLASAAALVVPLRVGGGTRLKIVEGMAMGKAIVSTSLGAEGIEAAPERDILIADDPERFAASVVRLLDHPDLAARLGRSARQLAVERYSWRAAASRLEQFFGEIVAASAAVAERPREAVGA